MKILVDITTGYCVGVGVGIIWENIPNAYTKPAFIDDQFWLWQWNKVGDIQLQASWTKQPIPPKQPTEIINSDRFFCSAFQGEILKQLRAQAMTDADRGTLLVTIQLGMNVLSWGDAQVARAAFNSIATTALWTAQRKAWVLAQIDAYLAS